jgi:hypothetical protein
VFLNPKAGAYGFQAGAYGFLNTQPDLSWDSTLALFITEMEMLSIQNIFLN